MMPANAEKLQAFAAIDAADLTPEQMANAQLLIIVRSLLRTIDGDLRHWTLEQILAYVRRAGVAVAD